MRKGIYFTLDAFFGTLLIGMAIVISSQYFISDTSQPQISHYSQDIITSLSSIKISEVNDTYIKSLIETGEIFNLDNSVIEQIGEFYVLNKSELANNLSKLIGEKLVPKKFGFEILVNDESLFLSESENNASTELISSRRLISGIEKFKPLRGATSKVFLEGIRNKRYSSYLYFGGFIGQGNITTNITDIPLDAELLSMELELDSAGNFTLWINSMQCNSEFIVLSNLTVADRWNITNCLPLLDKGVHNKVEIRFTSVLSDSFVAGGFLKVDYRTQQLAEYFEGHKIKYRFPGIDGVVNLYDAFYVPGTITSMKMHLHFKANDTSYLTIGGKIIHQWEGSEEEQSHIITNEDLATAQYLFLDEDYPLFSNNTVPVRFASYEDITTVIVGGNADVILITDLSASMKNAVDSWGQGNAAPTCQNFYENPNTRRTRAAVCLDLELVDTVMNYTGNRVWPVFMRSNSIINYTWNPADKNDVRNMILNYYNDQGFGKTCIACAINLAYDLLDLYSDESRKKFIILMSDGSPTHCAEGSCTSTSIIYESNEECAGICDTPGACHVGGIPGLCQDCIDSPGATENSYFSAHRAKDDLNVTIYTIGFGPMDCSLAHDTLHEIARIGNGTYQHSKNISELRLIYQNISYEILERINQYSQEVRVSGNITSSTMFPDSYIEIEYIPIAEQPAFDEIAISIEEDKFTSCNPSFVIHSGLRVSDAKVTSYSGHHWTESVLINGNEIYNITNYFLDYVRLGDPFFVYVPVNHIVNGTNTLRIETADTPLNKTGCSYNNTIIYTGLISSSVSYATVLPKSEGCRWMLEFDDLSTAVINVPQSYSGSKQCHYTNALISYDEEDSIDSAAYQLFRNLDFNNDGRIFVNIDSYNLVVNAISVQMIPYPWGPAVAEVRVWR
jgi:hypothetical protein